MKKNRTGTKKFPALILFLLGFLAGNLIPNIIWKAKWQQKTWASVYFLSTFAGKNTGNIEYLKEKDPKLKKHPVLQKITEESNPLVTIYHLR